MSFLLRCFLITAEFDDASRPPIARWPSDVMNHLYLSNHSFFFWTANTMEFCATLACFFTSSKLFSVFFFSRLMVSVALICFFGSLNNVEAIAWIDDAVSTFIFSPLTFIRKIPLSLAVWEW